MRLYEDNILPKLVILEYLGLSSWTFDRVLALWNATGDVVRQTNGVLGRPRLLHYKDIDYLKRLIQHRPNWFLDEVSKDECTAFRSRGRTRKGKRAVMKGVFVRGRRFSAEGLLTLDGMISSTVVEGSMTHALFIEYLEFMVV
jgi:hypothetical protein